MTQDSRRGDRCAQLKTNKKTPPITEVMRRGRNREEADGLWGMKKIRQSLSPHVRLVMLTNPRTSNSSITTDHTRLLGHVQRFCNEEIEIL
jgi:hypothetical protein